MYYITGDTHGNQITLERIIQDNLKPGDTIIVAGDFGMGFFDGPHYPEEMFYDYIEKQDCTVLFCDGNHEDFGKLSKYEVSIWNGGKVHFIRKNLIHLMRGEVYELEGKKMFVMGGGFSLDWMFRSRGVSWWPEEMPNNEEYDNASNNLEKCGYKVDYIITHTAPAGTVEYMSKMDKGIYNNVTEEMPLTGFLSWVEKVTEYEKWYFGHFHIDAELWKNQYALLRDLRILESGEVV